MLSILKGRQKLIAENAELRIKNEALLKKICQLRDKLSQEYLRRDKEWKNLRGLSRR